jgi:hypothetical protein
MGSFLALDFVVLATDAKEQHRTIAQIKNRWHRAFRGLSRFLKATFMTFPTK